MGVTYSDVIKLGKKLPERRTCSMEDIHLSSPPMTQNQGLKRAMSSSTVSSSASYDEEKQKSAMAVETDLPIPRAYSLI